MVDTNVKPHPKVARAERDLAELAELVDQRQRELERIRRARDEQEKRVENLRRMFG